MNIIRINYRQGRYELFFEQIFNSRIRGYNFI